jgi:hypothetical protein
VLLFLGVVVFDEVVEGSGGLVEMLDEFHDRVDDGSRWDKESGVPGK